MFLNLFVAGMPFYQVSRRFGSRVCQIPGGLTMKIDFAAALLHGFKRAFKSRLCIPVLILTVTVLLSNPVISEPEEDLPEQDRSISLRLSPGEEFKGEFEILVQGKSEISMLLVPKMTLMTQLTICGEQKAGPISKSGNSSSDSFLELETRTASISFYAPGDPNRDMDTSGIDQTLLTSGIPPKNKPVTYLMDSKSRIKEVRGVPASYTHFFQSGLLEYPEERVREGDKWHIKKKIPIAHSPDAPAEWCEMLATYTLTKILPDENSAELTMDAEYSNASGTCSQVEDGSQVLITGKSHGKLSVDLKTGFTFRTDINSTSKIEFSSANYIETLQFYTSKSDYKPVAPAAGNPAKKDDDSSIESGE